MHDIEELCQRVINIDNGRNFFDGPLAAIIDRFATHKIIGLTFAEVSNFDFTAFGEIVERTPASVRLRVLRARATDVCRDILGMCKVTDISVQEPPVEEVIRQLFREQVDKTGPDATGGG